MDTFEFSYNTPAVDSTGATVVTPTMFRLSGISVDVAKGIRFGLRRVTAANGAAVPIQDVIARRVTESAIDLEA